ncbi:MAG: GNAT family N-acetyltransferase [Pseudomonadota bacterium]
MSDDKLVIRRASLDDLDAVAACARAAYSKYLGRMDKEPAPMNADFERQISQGMVWVATKAHRLVGYVVFYAQGPDGLHLENIAVIPEMSGRGIGKALVQHVEEAARRAGKAAVELYTNEAMVENLAMYPKLGFVAIERKLQDGFDRVFFRKTL